MNYKIHKIHPAKLSRNNNIFIRVEFISEEGKWFKTDICPDYRNYRRWKPILDMGEGVVLMGLQPRKGATQELNADSYFEVVKKPNPFPEVKHEKKEKQLELI